MRSYTAAIVPPHGSFYVGLSCDGLLHGALVRWTLRMAGRERERERERERARERERERDSCVRVFSCLVF